MRIQHPGHGRGIGREADNGFAALAGTYFRHANAAGLRRCARHICSPDQLWCQFSRGR